MEFTTVGRLTTSSLYDGHWTREIDPITFFEMDMIFYTLCARLIKDATTLPIEYVSENLKILTDCWASWSYTMLNYQNKPGFIGLIDLLKTFKDMCRDLQIIMEERNSIESIVEYIHSQTTILFTK